MASEGSGRILVVDDDALIRETLATALGDEGYAVRVAPDGRAALSALGTWRPDVIVLDLMMPIMDGVAFRAAQRSVAETAQIPVIVWIPRRSSPNHSIWARYSTPSPVSWTSGRSSLQLSGAAARLSVDK